MPDFNIRAPFIIKHTASGNVLDVYNGSDPNRQEIVLYPYNGGSNQIFVYRDGHIFSQKNGLVLDMSQQPGDRFAVTTCSAHDGSHQQWDFKQHGRIKNKVGLVMDVRSSPAPIHPLLSVYGAEKRKRSDDQKFEFINV